MSDAVWDMFVLLRDPAGAQNEAGDRPGDPVGAHSDMVVHLRDHAGAVKVCSGDVRG